MFTLQQMKTAHSKVKSGVDFPRYVAEIKALGLRRYIFSVNDGHTTYYGDNGHEVSSPAIYPLKTINANSSADALRQTITIHQQGKTDFPTFCTQAAAAGVKQWVIDTKRMVCIYENTGGGEMVVEPIPDGGY